MSHTSREKIYLKNYTAPSFTISSTELFFNIQDHATRVKSRLKLEKKDPEALLELDGDELKLISIHLDGRPLSENEYRLSDEQLILPNLPKACVLEIEVEIQPHKNTALEGLYASGRNLLTQCEAQGFRRITYFMDRPDVMSDFTVTIEADEANYPVLLSNGDLMESQKLANGRHQAVWHDPFKKPCYLFALVAGPLAKTEDTFLTRSGKPVKLQIYTDEKNIPRCGFAMASLKKAMKWDEERYGLEYDLSTYMIVSTDDFNAGAMENKGLNVFNSRLVLADPKSATDDNYMAIESVVAHEYFHNWTGNRVTLRDWFHLSLKEGLTVFRDQEFTMDMEGRDLTRIMNVIDLRETQFAEDAGPNAHPIRPESCYAVDNFFTATIYEKGSEVIRMMQTMVGRPGFRAGMDEYFKRHDGQAVIIEDFAKAIADANGHKWEQFRLWYSQAGTPHVKVTESFQNGTYILDLEQSCPATPGQPEKKPFHIPLVIGLVGTKGEDLAVSNPQVVQNSEGRNLIHLREERMRLEFTGFQQKPYLSLNRKFSAPIILNWNPPIEELFALYAFDHDPFNRWEAGQKLMTQAFGQYVTSVRSGQTATLDPRLAEAQRNILKDRRLLPALQRLMVTLPSIALLAQTLPDFDAVVWQKAHDKLNRDLSHALVDLAKDIYQRLHGKSDSSIEPQARGERALKNWALSRLCAAEQGLELAQRQFQQTSLMVDQEHALALLAHYSQELGNLALVQFHQQWRTDALVMNKWWAIQASCEAPWTFERVQKLAQHPEFNRKNPNMVYGLFARFGDNLTQFHTDAKCYQFFAGEIKKIDEMNPQVAARLASSFDFCTQVNRSLRSEALAVLQGLLGQNLSSNTFERIQNAVNALKDTLTEGSL